ncbi:MAG: GNAT family N-acetyltransferase [Sulfurimonas sp.]|nr:GNAT family N-acetyltransferase [Sulfurimonas sp.]MDQ7060469.1 GNAT family N-acetyltransferase [Sulfurimonas sp.]
MSRDLYFLRSSEQKIIETLVSIAHPKDNEDLEKYTKFYGLTTKDLGLYALVNNKVAGAIWSRKGVMSVAIVPEFKGTGIGSYMMEQFLLEAATMHSELSIDISHKAKSLKFYEKFGFEMQENSTSLILIKKLERKEIIRPTDGYDPSRWMD